jgi:hypothetical protein
VAHKAVSVTALLADRVAVADMDSFLVAQAMKADIHPSKVMQVVQVDRPLATHSLAVAVVDQARSVQRHQ